MGKSEEEKRGMMPGYLMNELPVPCFTVLFNVHLITQAFKKLIFIFTQFLFGHKKINKTK